MDKTVNITNTTASQRKSQIIPSKSLPIINFREISTACVSGINQETVFTQGGKFVSGKNMPENKNMGEINRVK